ncbi:MAG: glycosyltransferase family 2 protein [Planctomycetota bacterium]
MRISACIIARDEADRIGPCLESVAFCDEIVVLDSGSRDETVRIAREAGARVLETDWPGWVAQKNRAVDAAANDWILSLDADERVDEALRRVFVAIREERAGEETDGPVAYEVTRLTYYLGRWMRHGGWYPEWRVRLFDRRHARWGGIDPHDRVDVRGATGRIREGNLLHVSYRSLADHVRQINRFTSVIADEMVKRGRRPGLLAMLFRPPFHVLRMYVVRAGFLDGLPGFVAAGMYGWYVFLKYAKAWEKVRGLGGEGR